MIITKLMLDEIVPKEMIPTRLDSAIILYTNTSYNGKSGIIVYNVNPDTWNCLYPFYELNHKFTVDNYTFDKDNMTYRQLIDEYKKIYNMIHENEKGYTKERRIKTLLSEFIKTFELDNVTIGDELTPIYELKFSKSKNVWTLYYFENYVANKIDDFNKLLNQNLYEQKILQLDPSIKELDGISITSNVPYTLSIEDNIEKLKKNKLPFAK